MNAKSKMKVLHNESAIEMNKIFAKMVENPFSEEYAFLQKIRQDYPQYKVRIREIKKNPNKECWKGLTYAYMRDYIILHSTQEEEAAAVAEFNEMLLISRCHSKANRYPAIKKWFLAKYPEVAEFGMSAPAAEEETASKEDVTNNEEATNNDETSAPQSNKVVNLTQNNSELPMAACQ